MIDKYNQIWLNISLYAAIFYKDKNKILNKETIIKKVIDFFTCKTSS
jgi:hypothetical protein